MYISQPPTQTQSAIRKDVTKALKEQGLKGTELQEAIDNALDSKLNDLADTININKYKGRN